ncbi:MAG: hypothetical protein ACI80N_003871 [Gammaproteobacteria bacterium]|jgi:hypothetical protein
MSTKFVSITFLLLIFGLPLGQVGWELSRGEPVQALDVISSMRADRMRQFEDELREESLIHTLVSPYYQWALLSIGKGNEKAILGQDDWIFYRDDLDLITAPGFLQGQAWTAVDAAVDLRDQLASQGVELLFVPVPAKSMVETRHISRWTAEVSAAFNSDGAEFLQELEERGVHTVDLSALFAAARQGDTPLYLPRDTHWTPATMALAAREIAAQARRILADGGATLSPALEHEARPSTVHSPGDMIGMLRLPSPAQPFEPMRLDIEQVVTADSGEFVSFDTEAQVLVMGDSFTGVFSDPRFGLGEHAGLGEHLAMQLGTSIDVIMSAGGAARSVRESLARRARGVTGKRLVIWQIAQRELIETDGRWDAVDLSSSAEVGEAPVPSTARVLAEIVDVSRVPEGFEYDFCLAIYEYRVLEVRSGDIPGGPLWVAHIAIEDFVSGPGAEYAVGEKHTLQLEDIAGHHNLESTSFVDDTDSGRRIWFATALEAVD